MTNACKFNLKQEADSEHLAKLIAACTSAPLMLAFSGHIGAGKTTIIRAMLRALGVESAIKSPTFAIMESYHLPEFSVHHFDLYRLHDEEELEYIGFRDYLLQDAVCFVEWPEHGGQFLSGKDVLLTLDTQGVGRVIQIQAYTKRGEDFVDSLIRAYHHDSY